MIIINKIHFCWEYFGCFEAFKSCLLYTSDAADDEVRVDLGGRRIIKKTFFQAEDGILDREKSRGLGDVYKRQMNDYETFLFLLPFRVAKIIILIIL